MHNGYHPPGGISHQHVGREGVTHPDPFNASLVTGAAGFPEHCSALDLGLNMGLEHWEGNLHPYILHNRRGKTKRTQITQNDHNVH